MEDMKPPKLTKMIKIESQTALVDNLEDSTSIGTYRDPEEQAKLLLQHLQMIQQSLFLNKEDNSGIDISDEQKSFFCIFWFQLFVFCFYLNGSRREKVCKKSLSIQPPQRSGKSEKEHPPIIIWLHDDVICEWPLRGMKISQNTTTIWQQDGTRLFANLRLPWGY